MTGWAGCGPWISYSEEGGFMPAKSKKGSSPKKAEKKLAKKPKAGYKK